MTMYQVDITITNICEHNNKVPNTWKKDYRAKGEIKSSPMTVGKPTLPHLNNRKTTQVNKEREDLQEIINQLDLADTEHFTQW